MLCLCSRYLLKKKPEASDQIIEFKEATKPQFDRKPKVACFVHSTDKRASRPQQNEAAELQNSFFSKMNRCLPGLPAEQRCGIIWGTKTKVIGNRNSRLVSLACRPVVSTDRQECVKPRSRSPRQPVHRALIVRFVEEECCALIQSPYNEAT